MRQFGVLLGLSVAALGLAPAAGQVVTDGTVGPARTLSGPEIAIGAELGTQQGGNLFHSFERFDIPAGERATFSGPENVANVISRVTGGQVSRIDGTLRSTIPEADVYLLNPSGVMFGPDAEIDIQGSLAVSTADEITFPDGGRYSATDPDASVLSVAPPEAFGFLTANNAAIEIDRTDISLTEGADLAIVGGEIIVAGPGGDVSAEPFGDVRNAIVTPSGDVSVVAVVGPATVKTNGRVNEAAGFGPIVLSDTIFQLSPSLAGRIDDVREGERIEAPGGAFTLRGGDVLIEESWILSNNFSAEPSGNFVISAEALTITDPLFVDFSRDFEEIGTRIEMWSLGEGPGGDIRFEVDQSDITNGFYLSRTFSAARGGDIVFTGGDFRFHEAPLVRVDTRGPGAGGDLRFNGRSLTFDTGFELTSEFLAFLGDNIAGTSLHTETRSSGAAGDVLIDVSELFIGGNADISVRGRSDGTLGDLRVTADRVIMDSGNLFSWTRDNATPGKLEVSARDIRIDSGETFEAAGFGVGIFTFTEDFGDAADLTVNAETLQLTRAGGIFTFSEPGNSELRSPRRDVGAGATGEIAVTADTILIDSGLSEIPEDFSFSIDLGASSINNGGPVSPVTVTASERITVTGIDSVIGSENRRTTEAGGEVLVSAPVVEVLSGASIFSFNTQSFDPENLETGAKGGNLTIEANSLRIVSPPGFPLVSSISSGASPIRSTGAGEITDPLGDAGNLTLRVGRVELSDGLVESTSFGASRAGTITVTATDEIVANGTGRILSLSDLFGPDFRPDLREDQTDRFTGITGFTSNVAAETGRAGGDITLIAPAITLTGGAIVASATNGIEEGGTIRIDTNRLDIASGGRLDAGTFGSGDGGAIRVEAGERAIFGGAGSGVAVESLSEAADAGLAGDVRLATPEFRLADGARITTDSAIGDGGNVTVEARDIVYLNDAAITTSVGGRLGQGGNIAIGTPEFVVLDRSGIQANAFGGPGGNITIAGRTFLPSADSVVEASSALSVDGTVTILAPEIDLSNAVTLLTPELLDAQDRLAAQCGAREGEARATFTGRGAAALPAQPVDAIAAFYGEDGGMSMSTGVGGLTLDIACHR